MPKPIPPLPPGAPTDAVKTEFARRLQRLMYSKGWNQSDLARAVEKRLGRPFGRDNVSHYIRGKSLPREDIQAALAAVLGVDPSEIVPPVARASAANRNPPIDIRALEDGNAWLKINMAVPFGVAVKVLNLVNPDDGSDED